MSEQLNNGQGLGVDQSIFASAGQPGVDIIGDNARLDINRNGSITAADEGNSAVLSSGNGVDVRNDGQISGALNGISSSGNDFSLRNGRRTTISSDSRAVDITDGDNINVNNSGNILGTGNQRNGTLYVDGTVDNFRLDNERGGSIDAGEGNSGDGFSIQIGAEGDLINENINITNNGTIAGRGQAEFAPGEGRLTGNGSSGVRYFSGAEGETTVTGTLNNRGTISSEVNVGFLGGVVVEDNVSYQGQIRNSGSITGPRNGLYIGNASHELEIFNDNRGSITSGSRVVNLDGDNVTFNNNGSVLGTGDQRNGTLYVDGTADNIAINNGRRGIIDAGEGNNGSGVSIQVGDGDDLETSVNLVNEGTIHGRGSENVPAGVRLFVGSSVGASTFTGDISNGRRAVIASEQGAGILIEDNVTFNGQINNQGTIRGGNGLAIDASGAFGDISVVNDRRGRLEGAVVLGEGNDTLINSSRDGLNITGGGGNDVLTGGSGTNIYSFDIGSGQDTITDFQSGQDVLNLGSYFGGDVSQALGATVQNGNDALIDLGDNNSITLANVDAASLGAESFSFG